MAKLYIKVVDGKTFLTLKECPYYKEDDGYSPRERICNEYDIFDGNCRTCANRPHGL